ncbi:Uncharacterised protein [Mycobacteroides abscessus subsp. abscessus]|nr:Uncharacterised protein [Mycobacteroides abscessus subsp. abscessus]
MSSSGTPSTTTGWRGMTRYSSGAANRCAKSCTERTSDPRGPPSSIRTDRQPIAYWCSVIC